MANDRRHTARYALLALPLLVVARCEPGCEPLVPPPPAPIDAPALGSGTTPYRVPVADVGAASWGTTHAGYPAADVFVRCGAGLVSPVNGVVLEARRVNAYDPAVDNPATRGGRSVAIAGDDGVRYYLAHFESIDDGIEPGVRVAVGQRLGLMGRTGRASACHVHFGLSPPCPGKEWSVRRGVIWPYPYLDDWRRGGQLSPVAEVEQWVTTHPTACADAMADPYASDS
jgi:murein DD-endopeptidase MepM/ murein hydrolase activator NlpD